MHPNNATSPAANNDSDVEDITVDLYPFIREYKGGRIKRFLRSPLVAASEGAAANRGVATKDVVVDEATGVSARLFLPSVAAAAGGGGERLPVIMYVHGGSFCTESAFCRTYHYYARSLAAHARALVVSVEYRLAPENPVPAAYDDAWGALRWVTSLSDSWLSSYGDPGRTFLAGDSAGGNIVYNTAVRASRGSGIDIEGLVIVHPYFWGVDRLSSSETTWDGVAMFTPERIDRLWPFVTAGKLGDDDPRVNPVDEEISSLACRRVLVAVAGKDSLRDRGRQLAARMRHRRASADAVTLLESEGEDHVFHLHNPLRATSKILMESIVEFVNQPTVASPLPAALLPELHAYACQGKEPSAGETMNCRGQPITLGVPTRPYVDVFGYGPRNMTRNSCLQIGQGRTPKTTKYGSFLGQVRHTTQTNGLSPSATVAGGYVFRNFI
uniref:Uncharacterized protein n=1 Tax=Avena sativa TaxID=4498 RepID=A0ACD6AIU4_AVESA